MKTVLKGRGKMNGNLSRKFRNGKLQAYSVVELVSPGGAWSGFLRITIGNQPEKGRGPFLVDTSSTAMTKDPFCLAVFPKERWGKLIYIMPTKCEQVNDDWKCCFLNK